MDFLKNLGMRCASLLSIGVEDVPFLGAGGDPGAEAGKGEGKADEEGAAGGGEGGGEPGKTPEFVSKADYDKLESSMTQMSATMQTMQEGFTTAMSAIQQNMGNVPEKNPSPAITSDDIASVEKALADGEGANAILSLVNKATTDALSKFKKAEVDPMRTQGMESIALLSGAEVRKMPHYEKYKKEVDTYINGLPIESRINPQAHMLAYNTVVGQHFEEILAEDREKMLRSGGGNGAGTPGNAAGRTPGGENEKAKSAVEVFGQDSADALSAVGMDEEAFAKKLGYKDWATYVELANSQ